MSKSTDSLVSKILLIGQLVQEIKEELEDMKRKKVVIDLSAIPAGISTSIFPTYRSMNCTCSARNDNECVC